jgi:hypothetical protein
MPKKSERGNVIELVIIGVLVLGVIGLLAWRFIDTTTKTTTGSDTQTSTSSTSQDTTNKIALGYEGVRTTSKKGTFSIVVPNGWKMMNALNNDSIMSGPNINNIRYDASKSPEITEVDGGGWDGYTEYFYVEVPSQSIATKGTISELVLNDGTKAQKMAWSEEKGTETYAGPLDDTYTDYVYLITKGNVIVQAQFAIFNKTEYDRSIIDQVVKSIEIK